MSGARIFPTARGPRPAAAVAFSSMAAPTLAAAAAMATTTVGSALSASFSDGSKADFSLAYPPFFITGDLVADGKGGKLSVDALAIRIPPGMQEPGA